MAKTKWEIIAERKRAKKIENQTGLGDPELKWATCPFCGIRVCLNNNLAKKIKFYPGQRVDKTWMCMGCLSHGRGEWMKHMYLRWVEAIRKGCTKDTPQLKKCKHCKALKEMKRFMHSVPKEFRE